MKKLLGIIVLGLLWCNVVISAVLPGEEKKDPVTRIESDLKLKCVSDDRTIIRTIEILKTSWSNGETVIGGYDNGFKGDVIETGSTYNLSVERDGPIWKYIIDKDVTLARMWIEHTNGTRGTMFVLECLVLVNTINEKGIEAGTTSGTAFFVSNKGYLLTNNHVVEGCKLSKINYFNEEYDAKLISTDKRLDLALLKVKVKPKSYISFSKDEPKKRQTITVAGYPLGKGLSDDLKINDGRISSLKGFENNSNEITVDVAINPGNSGGPIINQKGQLVAIAVAGMSKDVTEGINFGIKASAAENFLKSNNINPSVGIQKFSMDDDKLVKLLEESTVYTFCN